ncbi:MAG: DUF2064 domain-containing protein [Haliea sp.]|nr:DUF2064 domain-containing protein [Haliea sp.]
MPADAGDTLLIQFARCPEVGAVKTRMIPNLSPQQACDLHCDLVRWTARRLVACRLGPVRLAVTGDVSHPLFADCRDLGVNQVVEQEGGDLGERMYRALGAGLAHYRKVILVGSDCPELDRACLQQAVAALERVPVVLGPAADGGYVLIGAREISREIFREIDWGSSSVYARTVSRLEDAAISWEALPVKRDVDRPGDLAYWSRVKARGGLGGPA